MKTRITFDEACAAWMNGGTFEQFMNDTRSYVRRYAERRARCMRLPDCIQLEDIEQEFYMRAWQAGQAYDASRGTNPGKYILMGGYRNANVWLHKQRGAESRNLRAPSRCAVPFSRMARRDSEQFDTLEWLGAEEPTAEESVYAKERARTVMARLTPEDAELFLALMERGGNIAAALRDQPRARRRIRKALAGLESEQA
jgi:DNA-directed RNA polymerase specialized sigma24 family protein